MDDEKDMTSRGSQEVLMMVDMFDCLDGQQQLEVLRILIEKLENGEIELNGRQIMPDEIGIDNVHVCCDNILNMLSADETVNNHVQGTIG